MGKKSKQQKSKGKPHKPSVSIPATPSSDTNGMSAAPEKNDTSVDSHSNVASPFHTPLTSPSSPAADLPSMDSVVQQAFDSPQQEEQGTLKLSRDPETETAQYQDQAKLLEGKEDDRSPSGPEQKPDLEPEYQEKTEEDKEYELLDQELGQSQDEDLPDPEEFQSQQKADSEEKEKDLPALPESVSERDPLQHEEYEQIPLQLQPGQEEPLPTNTEADTQIDEHGDWIAETDSETQTDMETLADVDAQAKGISPTHSQYDATQREQALPYVGAQAHSDAGTGATEMEARIEAQSMAEAGAEALVTEAEAEAAETQAQADAEAAEAEAEALAQAEVQAEALVQAEAEAEAARAEVEQAEFLAQAEAEEVEFLARAEAEAEALAQAEAEARVQADKEAEAQVEVRAAEEALDAQAKAHAQAHAGAEKGHIPALSATDVASKDILAIANVLATMKSALNSMSCSFARLGNQTEKMVSLTLDIKATEQLRQVQSALENQIARHKAEIEILRVSLKAKIKESVEEKIRSKLFAMVKDSVQEQIEEKVRYQLSIQIPEDLRKQVISHKRQILQVKTNLHNSEARRYNSLQTVPGPNARLRPLLRPLPTPEQSPVILISRSSSLGNSTLATPTTAFPQVPAPTPIKRITSSSLRSALLPETVPPTPSRLFPRDLTALFALSQDEARKLLREYGLDSAASSPARENARPRGLSIVAEENTDASLDDKADLDEGSDAHAKDMNRFMAHIGVPFLMIPAPKEKFDQSAPMSSKSRRKLLTPLIIK